jgi:hypothetical protein
VVKILENVTVKFVGIINCYLSGHPEAANYILPKNLLNSAAAMLIRGFASIHLVKYSTATTAYLYFPCVVVNGPTMSMPHLYNGHKGVMSYDGCEGACEFGENFWLAW